MSNMLLEISIRFPHLGIELENVGKSISVFGFEIAFYGIIISREYLEYMDDKDIGYIS